MTTTKPLDLDKEELHILGCDCERLRAENARLKSELHEVSLSPETASIVTDALHDQRGEYIKELRAEVAHLRGLIREHKEALQGTMAEVLIENQKLWTGAGLGK